MPERTILSDIPAWLQATGAAIVGALSALALGVINRGPALETVINARISAVLAADSERMRQMSDALDENSKRLERLRASVDALAAHISTLEEMLSAAGIQAPARPTLGIVET
jgi:hypothetical protein